MASKVSVTAKRSAVSATSGRTARTKTDGCANCKRLRAEIRELRENLRWVGAIALRRSNERRQEHVQ